MLDVAAVYAALGQRNFVIPRPHPELVTPRVLVMERLSGFAFDDAVGMQGADIDTEAVVKAGMIGFLEGAMLYGLFHGDLHSGNLMVLPDGRTALLDFGITGRLGDKRRLAFLRLLMGASMNDVRGQLAAMRDLGALPDDADLEAIIRDLDLEGPPVDPTTMSPEELTGEIQRVIKALLGYGARMPKELMLFVKNLVFLDGAIATLAPDLDLFGEIAEISIYFATTHGERIASEVGIDPRERELDLTGVKASFGVDADTATLTHRQIRQRRAVISERSGSGPGGAERTEQLLMAVPLLVAAVIGLVVGDGAAPPLPSHPPPARRPRRRSSSWRLLLAGFAGAGWAFGATALTLVATGGAAGLAGPRHPPADQPPRPPPPSLPRRWPPHPDHR